MLGSMFWSFAQTIASQGVGLIIATILARLIVPEAYGIIAAAQIFVALATTFASGGFANSLIQKKDADDKDYSTMFVFNTLFSVCLFALVYFLAPLIVKVFHQSFDRHLLIKVIRTLGVGIVLSSFNSFYRALIYKRLLFKKLFALTMCGTVLSAVLGIFLAYRGYGVWALVAQNLTSYAINAVLLFFTSKWRPKIYFSWHRFRPMFSYGFKMMLSGLMITIYADLASLIVANRHSTEDLAYYNKGISYPKMIVLNIVTAMNTVLFPVMSKMTDVGSIRNLVRKFNRISAFVITPMMFGFAAVAPAFIELFFTVKWLPAVPFLQICCLNYAIQPLGMASLQYLKASGRATEYLILDIVRKACGILLLIAAIFLNRGVWLIAMVEVVANFLAIFVNFRPGKRYLEYSVKQQIFDVLPKFLLAGAMFVGVCFVGMIPVWVGIKLFVQICMGAMVYLLGAVAFRMQELNELLDMMKRVLKKRTNTSQQTTG